MSLLREARRPCRRVLLCLVQPFGAFFSRGFLSLLLTGACLGLGTLLGDAAHALTPQQAHAIAAGETEERLKALQEAAATGDAALGPYLKALEDGAVRVSASQAFVMSGSSAVLAGAGTPSALPADAQEPMINNRLRGAIAAVQSSLNLLSNDREVRAQALRQLTTAGVDASQLALIEKALAVETDGELRASLEKLKALASVAAEDSAKRLAAVQRLAESGEPSVRSLLQERLAPGAETDAQVRSAIVRAVAAIESRLAWGERLGIIFSGISLGSILVIVALGLAITYGLMGVINMAHGELMMIGAYATYLVQGLFRQWLPGAFDYYVLAAVPVAFLSAALVGAALERTVLRWLYGRPLETLLATWGISLILIQAVRTLFGAQNVPLENPAWMSGGLAVLPNLTLPYNRMVIIAFAGLVLLGVALLIARTRLGLMVRGVTQNRRMASCVGVNTARVDTLAFALGSGIAGLAGCALSQVGNVGPDLGQAYIVDAFMVVVLGGVGQLAGTVVAGLGLGVLNKLLEDWAGAVLAKIMVLVFIVLFIQKRPQGLFAMRGRSAEA
ncbi:MAG: urea ABC transporter permease subunit UrtB [Rhodoferax sp.]|nr:urea ABC transporter permease subunit UrtB [Rhodoferax sp.]